jgi:hypothetical protein
MKSCQYICPHPYYTYTHLQASDTRVSNNQTCLQSPIWLSLSLHLRHLLYPLLTVLKSSTVYFILGTNSPSLPDPNFSGRQIEDRGHTSSVPASGSRHQTREMGKAKTGVLLGLGLAGALLTVALVNVFYPGGSQPNNPNRPRPTSTTQPTNNSTQPASPPQPNNPPRAVVGREERNLGRGLSVDTSSEPYPILHLDDIADAGSSEARYIDQDG